MKKKKQNIYDEIEELNSLMLKIKEEKNKKVKEVFFEIVQDLEELSKKNGLIKTIIEVSPSSLDKSFLNIVLYFTNSKSTDSKSIIFFGTNSLDSKMSELSEFSYTKEVAELMKKVKFLEEDPDRETFQYDFKKLLRSVEFQSGEIKQMINTNNFYEEYSSFLTLKAAENNMVELEVALKTKRNKKNFKI